MNIFVVTLGAREIQIKKEFINDEFELSVLNASSSNVTLSNRSKPETKIQLYQNNANPQYYCHASPREAGKTIMENYDVFRRLICFPIIEGSLSKILENHQVNKILIVCTDQKDLDHSKANSSRNFANDTVHYKDVLMRFLPEINPSLKETVVDEIVIGEKVVDIDYQYKFFSNKISSLDINFCENIFLLPQGGIDQINHALTLKLIQAAGKKVKIWQQSESLVSRELNFTHHFLDDLIKHQIISLINIGEYQAALILCGNITFKNKKLEKIISFMRLRKEQLFDDAAKVFNKGEKGIPAYIDEFNTNKIWLNSKMIQCFDGFKQEKQFFHSCERLALAQFYWGIKDYTKFTLSFSVFLESFIVLYVSWCSGYDLIKTYDNAGKKLIKKIKDQNQELSDNILKTLNKRSSKKIEDFGLSFPVLILSAHWYANNKGHDTVLRITDLLFRINGMLNNNDAQSRNFDKLRNDIAHKGKSVSENDLINATDTGKTIQWWEESISDVVDLFFKSENPYVEGNNVIRNYLNT